MVWERKHRVHVEIIVTWIYWVNKNIMLKSISPPFYSFKCGSKHIFNYTGAAHCVSTGQIAVTQEAQHHGWGPTHPRYTVKGTLVTRGPGRYDLDQGFPVWGLRTEARWSVNFIYIHLAVPGLQLQQMNLATACGVQCSDQESSSLHPLKAES